MEKNREVRGPEREHRKVVERWTERRGGKAAGEPLERVSAPGAISRVLWDGGNGELQGPQRKLLAAEQGDGRAGDENLPARTFGFGDNSQGRRESFEGQNYIAGIRMVRGQQ